MVGGFIESGRGWSSRRPPMGYLGAGRLGVKRVGDGIIGQEKWEIGSKEISGSNKNGRNSKLRLGDRAK